MTDEATDDGTTPPSPDEAFAAIGHEVRIGILEALANTDRADRPLSFSALHDRVGDLDSARFNYHLGELVGHFVERTDEGYDFRPPGKRLTQAIRSGAVTADPEVELTRIDRACHHCGASVLATYREERVGLYCPECPGTYGSSNHQASSAAIPDDYGFLGYVALPPAGLADRSLAEARDAAYVWSLADTVLMAADICPRCSAPFDRRVDVCETHDVTDGRCGDCDYRVAVVCSASCTNCTFDQRVPYGVTLLDDTDLQAFLTAHGINLVAPDVAAHSAAVQEYDETVLGTDPLEARFTFTADGDALTLTVEGFEVVDAERSPAG